MSGNAEASNSRRMTVIEEGSRDANKPFWSLSKEYEEAQTNNEQDDRVEDAEATDGAYSGDREDATTTDGADHTDCGIGGSQTAQKNKKQRKDRTPQALGNITDTFTVVLPSGLPV